MAAESKVDNEGGLNLVGRWMNIVSVDGLNGASARFYGVHHVNITRHSSQGVVEGKLIKTDFLKNGTHSTTTYNKDMTYIGVIQNDTLTLNYKDGSYTAVSTLKMKEFSMNGTWYDSANQKGTTKWIKACKLLQ